MNSKTFVSALLGVSLLALLPAAAFAKLRVAASTTDLGSIAASVGGDQVEVFAIARPTSDVHRVEVLPSYMVKVARAQLYLKVGLGLDQWADGIIAGSRNDKLTIVDCGAGIDALEKPTGKVTAALGDVHPNGNPHYWLDPRNGAIVAHEVAEAFATADPAHAADYRARADAFAKQADAAYAEGQKTAAALPSKVILTYHASWVYLAHAMGLEIAGTVEPVPGIPPTARHLASLIEIIKARKIGVLLQEPYFSADAGQFLARNSSMRVVTVSASCDGPVAGAYLAHIGDIVHQIGGTAAEAAK
jgi:zinc/manganese transport system substrate-binding protein